ncbi:MAG: hypothetical protein R3B91_02800 [Planctomycetaceae bacterium]
MFRYVGKPSDVEKAPYQERAFYMSVIVMLPDVPNFLTELASSEWPIRIGRFHIGQNPYRDGSTRTMASSARRSTRISSRGRVVADALPKTMTMIPRFAVWGVASVEQCPEDFRVGVEVPVECVVPVGRAASVG